jgi:hypothetical protein
MQRRSVDEIERRIAQWEQTRDELGATAAHGLIRVINDEIDRLRYEKLARDRPLSDGRRATDRPQRVEAPNPIRR